MCDLSHIPNASQSGKLDISKNSKIVARRLPRLPSPAAPISFLTCSACRHTSCASPPQCQGPARSPPPRPVVVVPTESCPGDARQPAPVGPAPLFPVGRPGWAPCLGGSSASWPGPALTRSELARRTIDRPTPPTPKTRKGAISPVSMRTAQRLPITTNQGNPIGLGHPIGQATGAGRPPRRAASFDSPNPFRLCPCIIYSGPALGLTSPREQAKAPIIWAISACRGASI